MKSAILRGNGLVNNIIFDSKHPANRDNCFTPYALLRDKFLKFNTQINTADKSPSQNLIFEIHQDVQSVTNASINYLLMLETEFVKKMNADIGKCNKYKKIFTWRDDLVDGNRFIKINFPNPISIHAANGFLDRDRLCCLIAGNKTLSTKEERDLYVERLNSIRWFENNAPEDFDLYGVDWDLPAWGRGKFGKLMRRILRFFSYVKHMRPFPSYRGRILNKSDVLRRTRFAICYENVRDLPGYITEKIFDCFFSGCVPVYWGASNITDYIPADCFIDRRQFHDTADVYQYMKTMTEQDFIGYQQRIAEFLQSDAAYPFSSEFFVETIVNTIVQDIGLEP